MKLKVLKIEKIIEGENIEIFPVLIQNDDRNYLVDCGYEATFEELKSKLNFHKVRIQDLTGVIITHDDYDHLEGLKSLKNRNANLKVFCGEFEKDSVSGAIKSERLIQAEASLPTIPEEFKTWSLNFIHKLKNVQRFEVNHTLTDNEFFENDIIVIHTPGHTKGHISLFCTSEKTLIAGDALVVEEGKFNIANPNFTLDMEAALNSVEKIKTLNPKKIICYHGGIMEENIEKELEGLIDRYKN